MAAKSSRATKGSVAPGTIAISVTESSAEAATLTISGVPAEAYRSPEKVQKLLDALGMPKGTSVRVTVEAASVIVR